MRVPILFLGIVGIALAQQPAPVSGAGSAKPVLAQGVPLRVALGRRVVIKKVGDPIQASLIEPVYVFDRVVVPVGTVVEGHVAKIGGVPLGRRVIAILSGNLTPPREIYAQFDRIVLNGGLRLPLVTSPSTGTARTAVVETLTGQDRRKPTHQAGGAGLEGLNCPAAPAFRLPGKFQRLKSRLFSMLPYDRQSWASGTLFNAVVQEPMDVPSPDRGAAESGCRAIATDGTQQVRVRLVTPVSSASAHRGDRVEALVTRPLFAADHALLIPEGSRLVGEVVSVRRARFLHRNGILLFGFRQLIVSAGMTQHVQGNITELEADAGAHLRLDSEGGAHVSNPKTRFIFPAIAATVAGLSLHQDYNSQGIPDQDVGGRAEAGAVGLGLIGTVLAQASRPLASTIAFTGAGFSLYSTFLARGADVALPAGTAMKITLNSERQPRP
jgi:hypothetical protein